MFLLFEFHKEQENDENTKCSSGENRYDKKANRWAKMLRRHHLE